MKVKLAMLILLTMTMTYGCSIKEIPVEHSTAPVATKTLTRLPIQTEAKLTQATETRSATVTETLAASPSPFVPFNASVWADNVNVRTNPGYLFPAQKGPLSPSWVNHQAGSGCMSGCRTGDQGGCLPS